ncbi:MAG: heparinase II/III family protein [Hyphomicrobiales bacterium]|nr:heparinase II/III family protein [Hyphomicrobiales bacterium]
MSRVSVAERTKLSVLLASSLVRKAVNRVLTHPIVDWPFSFAKADRLLIAPQDLRTADATRASEIYSGRFVFAGKVVTCDSRSPFESAPPSEDWAMALHGFGWLRHLRAAESGITRANARALVDEWISLNSIRDPIAWRPDVVARRIISWLSQAPLLLDDSDVRFYRRFLRSLSRQVRHLRHTISEARDGVPRFQATVALTYATLCMAGQQRHMRSVARRLGAELVRQVLPDGGHLSRNPGALVELLVDLLPLRTAFTARNMPPPQELLNAIDRMMPMLRFFRHGDGNFALFNGMGPTQSSLITTILAYDDTRGAPLANAPHSGYQRLEAGGTLLLMDTGGVPPLPVSQEAHAGCLSFELSARQNRIVVNCGLPLTSRDSWRQVARATAAHSTATLNDTSSCRFIDTGPVKHILEGVPMIGGPTAIQVAREEQPNGTVLRASHDGYAESFNIIHERVLLLSADGQRLDGEDLFTPASGESIPAGRDQFAVRFHLHPSIKANRLSDGHSAMLLMPNKDVWTFNAYEDQVDIEESVFLAANDGPRRTMQIVIYGRARKVMRVQWTFVAHAGKAATTGTAASTAPARRGRGEEPELPL